MSMLPPLRITPIRLPANSARGRGEAAGGLDHQLQLSGQQPHRLHQRIVIDGRDFGDAFADHREGQLAGRLSLRAVCERLRNRYPDPLAALKGLADVVACLRLDADDATAW